ncbi:DNA-directed RNA polymerases II [Diplonema papillatum]|nr:DNA-directed RNA polymerases II [Diplonema papillatum]
MAASQVSAPTSVGVVSALSEQPVAQPETQPPATQEEAHDIDTGVQKMVQEWGNASDQGTVVGSLAQTAASSAVRSSISEVAEFAKQKKKTQTVYLCADCMEETRLGAADPVRCQACGNRILYKRRGNAPVQYEAK